MKNKLVYLGTAGTMLSAICCFTPFLPIVLTALGLTGLLGVLYNDVVLLPAMAIFILLTGYGLWRSRKPS
jgi:mercuric ion transport protein